MIFIGSLFHEIPISIVKVMKVQILFCDFDTVKISDLKY